MAPNRTPSESVCRKSSKLQGIVENDPVAALRLNEQVGLVGFAVLGTPGDPEQALRLLELRQPVADLAAIGLQLALRSEEHTSELQSPMYLVCRLLLEKKK